MSTNPVCPIGCNSSDSHDSGDYIHCRSGSMEYMISSGIEFRGPFFLNRLGMSGCSLSAHIAMVSHESLLKLSNL